MSSTHYLGICILYTHYLQWSLICSFLTDIVDVIHMSSLVLFIYPIMYNLVSTHCLHRCTLSMSSSCCAICTHHLLVISNTPHIPYYSQLSFRILSLHMHIVNVICILSIDAYVMYMYILLLFVYLYMYMSSAYYLSICVLCAHYLQWSLTCSFLTDNADVIHTSSPVLFIYPII